MAKIKLLTDAFDSNKKVTLEKGTIGDYGQERNELAIQKGYAEWFEETEKKEGKPKTSKKEKK